MTGFEKLLDILVGIWDWFIPFAVVDVEEEGIILRWGRYAPRKLAWFKAGPTLKPGFHWHWPFGIEKVKTASVVKTTHTVDVEAETQDGTPVAARIVVKYRVANIVPFLTEVGDEIDVLDDLAGASLFDEISNASDWATLRSHANNGMARRILESVRGEVNQFGFKIYTVKFKRLIKAPASILLGVPDSITTVYTKGGE